LEMRRLGRSGLQVSRTCLGTMAFGRWIDEQASAQVLDEAFEQGITFVDTANSYGSGQETGVFDRKGESEAILGRLLKGRRNQVVLATKVNGAMGPGPNDRGLSRSHIMAAVEDSLRRLQTDRIDLYQCHRPDPLTPLDETLRAFDDLVRQGKVRYIGCSNFAAWQIAKAHGISEAQNLVRFVSVQPQYSLLVRDVERELTPFCQSEGVGIIPFSPLGRGLLTGKYRPGVAAPAGTRAASGEQSLLKLMSDQNLNRVERFRTLCQDWNLSMATVAQAFVLANPAVTSAIVGASKPEQVRDAAKATTVTLAPEQLQALDQIFPI